VVDKEDIYLALSDVYDPEIRVNIVELGLIYDVQIDGKIAKIKMTLTSPNCPASSEIKNNVIRNAKSLKGIDDVELELVWEPKWNYSLMSEEARLELGFDIFTDTDNGKDCLA